MNALDFLNRLKKLPRIIENCEIQKIAWEERAYNTTSGGVSIKLQNQKGEEIIHNMERVQSSSGGDPLGVAVANYVDIERKIKALKTEKEWADSIVEQLEPDEYDVLYKYFVLDFRLYEIADKMKLSYSGVGKIQKSGLQNLQIILDNMKK